MWYVCLCLVMVQQGDYWQCEVGGFVGVGLGDFQYIVVFQCGWNCCSLNWCWVFIVCFGDGLQNFGVEFQIGKFGYLGFLC